MDENGRNAELRKKTEVHIEGEIESSLIPSSVIDHASQRITIISLFILIQSWKLYDLLLLKLGTDANIPTSLNNFSFVLKYAIADGAFLWILPVLNIPLLTFSPLITLFMTLALNCLTLLLVSSIQLPIISTFIVPLWTSIFNNKELTIGGDSVTSEGFIDMESHFKGKYTIQYVPDSSAKFNPFQFERMCLDPAVSVPLQMPIEFNTTTELGLLQLEHVTPSNDIKLINYSHNELTKLLRKDHTHLLQYPDFITKDDKISYIEIPISQPGKYKIHKVTDKRGVSIRSFKSEFLISYCPNAKFEYSQNFNHHSYRCLNNEISSDTYDLPLVQISGVAPFNIKFATKLNGKNYASLSADITGELNTGDNLSWIQTSQITRNILEQQLLSRPEFFSDAKPGSLSFQLIEITDTMGVTQRYNPSSVDPDIFYQIDLNQVPKIEVYVDDEPLLVNKTKSINFRIRNEVKEADFPIVTFLSYTNPTNELLNYNFSKVFRNPVELSTGIEFDKPGIVSLISARSNYCPCEISGKPSILLELAEQPSIQTTATPIVDKCVGMTGYKFEFNFVGEPPFQLQYNVYENQTNGVLRPIHNERGMTSSVIKSYDSNYKFEYKPPAEGNYVIRFSSLKDLNYHSFPIVLDPTKNTYSTYFNQRSKVSFFDVKKTLRKDIRTCYGDSPRIPLYFKGDGPYSFEYELINIKSGKKLVDTIRVQNISSYEIETPQMTQDSTFQLKLLNIKDRHNCDVDYNQQESIFIHSRKDVPEIALNSKTQNIKIIEGDYLDIPLKIKSSVGKTALDEIEYNVADVSDISKKKHKVIKNSHTLRVKEEGIYSLTSFKNGGCNGNVLDMNESVNVTYFERPSLEVISDNVVRQHSDKSFVHLNPVCQHSENRVKLRLKGVAPFVVDYEIKLPSGKVESRTMLVQKNEFIISLPTGENGSYEHYFKRVYDKLYTKEKTLKLSERSHPAISYKIHASPSAEFNKNNILQVCETKLKNKDYALKVPVVLTGIYPFKVNATITHESSGMQNTLILDNVYENELNFQDVANSLSLGDHILTINSISDGNGCVSKRSSVLDMYIISVTPVPQITKSKNTNHYCVGDHISYNMTGIPPFTVYYKFNEKLQKAESAFKFQRLASKPGELSIIALQDSSAAQCTANFTENLEKYNNLKLQVYDLPSVEINQGDYIIRDVHEGEQSELTFHFSGTPPFNLTYIRTVNKLNNKSQKRETVVERTTVEDIWDYKYSTMVSLEGTYEAVEVQDAYCTAKRDI